jgi:Uma2 family endonuclease
MRISKLKQRLQKDRPVTTISLTMPEDVIEDLQLVALRLGFSDYQALIRAYVGQRLRNDWARGEDIMAIRRSQLLYTIDEYLTIERQSEDRHEYLDGNIFAMSGESDAHGEISANLSFIIGSQLRGTPCRMRIKDTKVRSGPTPHSGSTKGLFSYPDLVVICGELKFHDGHQDVVLNPTAIFEVLSESTEGFDRGEKFHRYRMWNPTLSDYLLVSQARPAIEHYIRQADGSWLYHFYSDLKYRLFIDAINCELRLPDVYERIVFPPEEAEEEEL